MSLLFPRMFYQSRGAFDPAPIAGNDSFTKILLHMDGSGGGTTFTDSNAGGSAHTWTATSVITSTPAVFGATSGLFTTGYIDTPDHADFTLGSGDFTLDFWLNMTGGFDGQLYRLFGQGSSGGTISSTSITGLRATDNKISVVACIAGVQTTVTSTSTIPAAAGWKHIAFVRSGNILKLFIDGTQEGGNVAFSGTVNDSSNKWAVGRWGEYTPEALAGMIDEFRLSVGIARWTSNFTPPTSPYS